MQMVCAPVCAKRTQCSLVLANRACTAGCSPCHQRCLCCSWRQKGSALAQGCVPPDSFLFFFFFDEVATRSYLNFCYGTGNVLTQCCRSQIQRCQPAAARSPVCLTMGVSLVETACAVRCRSAASAGWDPNAPLVSCTC